MHITVQVQAFIFAVCLMANNADGSRNSIKREGWVRVPGRQLLKTAEYPELCNVPTTPEHSLGLRPCKELEEEEKASKQEESLRHHERAHQMPTTAPTLPQSKAAQKEGKEPVETQKLQKTAAWWSEFKMLGLSFVAGVAFVCVILLYEMVCGSELPVHEYARVAVADGFADNGESDDGDLSL